MKKRMIYSLVLLVALLLVSCRGKGDDVGPTFEMKATVRAVGEKIEVEVIEAEYTSGVHWVITGEETEYVGGNGESLDRADIHPGATVKIVYNGQVMMSYPPQIVALRITVL